MFCMGICCKYGRGVEQNWEEAVHWYRRAVDAGSAAAMCNLGVCYERGEGVERDAAGGSPAVPTGGGAGGRGRPVQPGISV